MTKGWIGIEIIGTLITKEGKAIYPTIARIKNWQEKGIEVKLFTPDYISAVTAASLCKVLEDHYLTLEITDMIDGNMVELWSSSVVQTYPNTGIPVLTD